MSLCWHVKQNKVRFGICKSHSSVCQVCGKLLTKHGCFRGLTLAKLGRLRKLSMCDSPCVTDSSLSCLSSVTSLEHLKVDTCDKITDRGEHFVSFLLTVMHSTDAFHARAFLRLLHFMNMSEKLVWVQVCTICRPCMRCRASACATASQSWVKLLPASLR